MTSSQLSLLQVPGCNTTECREKYNFKKGCLYHLFIFIYIAYRPEEWKSALFNKNNFTVIFLAWPALMPNYWPQKSPSFCPVRLNISLNVYQGNKSHKQLQIKAITYHTRWFMKPEASAWSRDDEWTPRAQLSALTLQQARLRHAITPRPLHVNSALTSYILHTCVLVY